MLRTVSVHTGAYGHCKRVCTESWLLEKNPLPHRGIEPAPAACRSNALPYSCYLWLYLKTVNVMSICSSLVLLSCHKALSRIVFDLWYTKSSAKWKQLAISGKDTAVVHNSLCLPYHKPFVHLTQLVLWFTHNFATRIHSFVRNILTPHTQVTKSNTRTTTL